MFSRLTFSVFQLLVVLRERHLACKNSWYNFLRS